MPHYKLYGDETPVFRLVILGQPPCWEHYRFAWDAYKRKAELEQLFPQLKILIQCLFFKNQEEIKAFLLTATPNTNAELVVKLMERK